MAKDLYQTKDGKFGMLLARNSAGHLVLEMKGSGVVETHAPDDVEIVRPYTVRVRHIGGKTGTYDAVTTPGSVSVGDLVVTSSGALVRVAALDTKSTTDTVLRGSKLVTVAIDVLDVPDVDDGAEEDD